MLVDTALTIAIPIILDVHVAVITPNCCPLVLEDEVFRAIIIDAIAYESHSVV